MLSRLTWESLPDHYDLARPGHLKQALGNLVLPKPRGFVVRGLVPEDADRAYGIIEDYFEDEGIVWAPVVEGGYKMGEVAGGWHVDSRPTVGLTRHSFHRTYEGEAGASFVESKPEFWATIQDHQLSDEVKERFKRGEVDSAHFDTAGYQVALGVGDLCVFPLSGPFPPAHDFINTVEPRHSNVVDVMISIEQLRSALP